MFKDSETKKLAYILGPVRDVDPKRREPMERLAEDLKKDGWHVFDPINNAPQEDPTGYGIVMTELRFLRRMRDAKLKGGEVAVPIFWTDSPPSEGSRVDLGMVLGLRLPFDVKEDWGGAWNNSCEIAQRIKKNFFKRPGRRKINVPWTMEKGGNRFEWERIRFGMILALLSSTGGLKIKKFDLVGEDTNQKSYPKVIQEIMRRQKANEPLW